MPDTGSRLKGMTLHIICSSSPVNMASECDILSVLIMNHTKNIILSYNRGTASSFKDIEWQGFLSNLEPGNDVQVVVVLGHPFTVKKTIVHVIYGESADDIIMEYSSAIPAPGNNFTVANYILYFHKTFLHLLL